MTSVAWRRFAECAAHEMVGLRTTGKAKAESTDSRSASLSMRSVFGPSIPEALGDLERAVLVVGDSQCAVGRQRQVATELGQLASPRREGGDGTIARRQDDPGRVVPDKVDDPVRESDDVVDKIREHQVAGRIAGTKRQHGQIGVALGEAFTHDDRRPPDRDYARTGEALAAGRVEEQDVVGLRAIAGGRSHGSGRYVLRR